MAKKAAAAPVSEALDESDQLTTEEQTALDQEAGDQAPVAAPPEEAKPEQAEGDLKPLPSTKKEKPHEKVVSYDRFDEVNTRNKDLQRQLEEMAPIRERWARLEERQRMAQEARQAAEAAQAEAQRRAEEPDPNIDPVGHRAWRAEQTALAAVQRNQQLEQYISQFVQQRQVTDQNTDMNLWLNSQVPLARSLVPDYDARVDFARATRAGMWSRVYDLPDGRRVQLFSPEDAAKITEGEEVVLTTRAKMMGIPLHLVVNTLADSWGYRPANGAVANGNGAPRQVTGQLMPSGNERLEQIQRGQAVQGLGRTPSGEAPAAQAWQQMSAEEFKGFVANMNEDAYIEMVRDPRFGKQFERRVSMIDME